MERIAPHVAQWPNENQLSEKPTLVLPALQ
jgi:hypothetical protein